MRRHGAPACTLFRRRRRGATFWTRRAAAAHRSAAPQPADRPDRAAALSVSRLAGEPFIFFPRHLGPGFFDAIISFCRRAGFTPSIRQEAVQMQTIVSLVAAGMGVAL